MLDFVAFLVHHLKHGNQLLVAALRNNLVLETGLFVDLHLVGYTLNDVLVGNFTRVLRDDNSVVRIPRTNDVALLHFSTGLEHQG